MNILLRGRARGAGVLPEHDIVRRCRGLSLVETLVVAGLLTTTLLCVFGMIPVFRATSRRASLELEAGRRAQSYLEAQREGPFTIAPSQTMELPEPYYGVTFRQTVTETASPTGYSKRVRVVISWKWRSQDYSTFRETVIAKVRQP